MWPTMPDVSRGDVAGLLVQLSTAIYRWSNIADTRTWTTLPKEFQICCFLDAGERENRTELSVPNGIKMSVVLGAGEGTKIDLTSDKAQASLNGTGLINVVYVKSITAGTPPLVSQFKLK